MTTRRGAIASALGLLAAAALLGVSASVATAKESEARASLVTLLPRDAVPGTNLNVEWNIFFLRNGQPFGTTGVFIELVGPSGATTRARAVPDDDYSKPYRASVAVPAGGIADVKIGMNGTGQAGDDIYFQRIGPTFAALPLVTAPPQTAEAAASVRSVAGGAAAPAPTEATHASGPDVATFGLLAALVAVAVIAAAATRRGGDRRAADPSA